MTVAWSFRLAGAATRALSTSACNAPGSSGGGGGGGSPRRCASTLVVTIKTGIASRTMRFMRTSRSGRSLHISAPACSRSARQPNAWTEDPDEHDGDDECRDNPGRLELEYARDPPWFLHVRREDSRNEKQSKRQPERRADARDEDQLAPDRIERAAEQKQDAASE